MRSRSMENRNGSQRLTGVLGSSATTIDARRSGSTVAPLCRDAHARVRPVRSGRTCGDRPPRSTRRCRATARRIDVAHRVSPKAEDHGATDVIADALQTGDVAIGERHLLLAHPQRVPAVVRLDHRRLDEVHRWRAHELRHEHVVRMVVDLDRHVALHDRAVPHHRDTVPHRHRFVLVVGDVQRRETESSLEPHDHHPRLAPQRARRGSTSARPSTAIVGRARSPGPSPRVVAGHPRACSVDDRGRRRAAGPPRPPGCDEPPRPGAGGRDASGRRCCRRRSGADTARTAGTPWRCSARAARRGRGSRGRGARRRW